MGADAFAARLGLCYIPLPGTGPKVSVASAEGRLSVRPVTWGCQVPAEAVAAPLRGYPQVVSLFWFAGGDALSANARAFLTPRLPHLPNMGMILCSC